VLALVQRRPVQLAAGAAVLVAVVGAGVLYTAFDKSVTLSVDGRSESVHSFSGTVAALLDDQDLKVGTRDIVAPGLKSGLADGQTVVVRYARPLTLTVNGEQNTYWTTETSVDRALVALGLRAEGAQLSASRSARISRDGMTMWMSTPKRVTLVVGGKKRTLTTVAPTAGALLTEQKVTVQPLDKLSLVPTTPLKEGSVVKLTRIEHKRVTKKEKVSFGVVRKKSSSMYKGSTKVVTAGRAGKRTAVYDLVITNGKVTDRDLVSTKVTRKPVTQVLKVGTKSRPKAASSGGGGTPSGGGLNWTALAKCESGNNPKAVNPAGYYGLYQFSLSTWRAQGGSGSPIDASSAEQTRRAQILYGKTGAGSWPSCGPKLFT
jgi:uncharacterized protein YabE (DUF348 family)